ncbi:MAG: septal ring lytic transglycosylase RlpA family protein [Rubrivivax sp.]|nr:MAG: septal ring lytic transglycosylase RlpA family protein [Rubrivivax sp.]
MSSIVWPGTGAAHPLLPLQAGRRVRPVRLAMMRGLMSLLIALVAGCASSPTGTQPGKPGAVLRPGSSDRDGPPAQPPADLIKVPNARPRVEPIRQGGPNKPYVVLGQGYEPLAGDVAFKQRGLASWYGAKFHGRRTASGEVYSMYGMTAAHRTLPIPSYARIRELRSGKEIIVRINDRGPFHSSRVLDLSYTAALKLGVLSRGSAEVEIERLTFEDIRTGRWRSGDDDEEEGDKDGPTRLAAAVPDEPEPPVAIAAPRAVVRTASTSSAAGPINNPSAANSAGLAFDADPILALAARLEQARPLPVPESARPVEPDGIPSVPDAGADADAAPTPEGRAQAYTPGSKGYWVQLAAFRQRQGVDDFQKRVAQEMDHLAPLLAVYQDAGMYRLQAGPYGQRDQAQDVARRMRDVLQLEPMVVERR